MKKPSKAIRSVAFSVVLLVVPCLAMTGCGGQSSNGPPSDLGAKKTPSEVLKEAKAQAKAAKP